MRRIIENDIFISFFFLNFFLIRIFSIYLFFYEKQEFNERERESCLKYLYIFPNIKKNKYKVWNVNKLLLLCLCFQLKFLYLFIYFFLPLFIYCYSSCFSCVFFCCKIYICIVWKYLYLIITFSISKRFENVMNNFLLFICILWQKKQRKNTILRNTITLKRIL